MRSVKLKTILVAGLAASVTLLGACAGEKDPGADATPGASATANPSGSASASPSASSAPIKASTNLDAVTVTGKFGEEPKVKIKSPWAIDKTQTKVLQPNDAGAVIKEGSTVELNYYGVNGRTGEKFDDSFSRGAPVSFPLDQVVPGFSKGLVGQKQGSRVLIAMPGSDGYDAGGGNEQAGIKLGDTLVFVVDIVTVPLTGPVGDAVKPAAGLPTVVDKAGVPTITVPKTAAPKELKIQPLIKGKGKKVTEADTITFNYTWARWSDGKVLEESYSTKPAEYALSGLLPGMQKGLVNQTVGSRVLLVIPPADGYPQGNETPKIEPTDTLVMVVDILFTQSQ